MKKYKNSFVPFILFFIISFSTFIIIRENVDLKKIKHKITILELRYPWLLITENNNSKWKVILEDTLKKKGYILIDTTVKSGEQFGIGITIKKMTIHKIQCFLDFI